MPSAFYFHNHNSRCRYDDNNVVPDPRRIFWLLNIRSDPLDSTPDLPQQLVHYVPLQLCPAANRNSDWFASATENFMICKYPYLFFRNNLTNSLSIFDFPLRPRYFLIRPTFYALN